MQTSTTQTTADRQLTGVASHSEAPGVQEPRERHRAPYTPPRLESLGAWLLTLQQTSPEII